MNQRKLTVSERFISTAADLFFIVPTMIIIWLSVNYILKDSDLFLGSIYLWVSILLLASVSFIFPKRFPNVIAMVWKVMGKINNVE